jgi:predicted transcriptional regulator
MRKITVTQPAPEFRPVTLVIESKVELANILGALLAYGKGKVYAEGELKAVGLGEFYSGNVRKASRELAAQIAEASNVVPLPEFQSYLSSTKFRSSHPSTAGAAVIGTSEDLAPGRSATSFE